MFPFPKCDILPVIMGATLPSYYTDKSFPERHLPFTHMSTSQTVLLGVSALAIAVAAAPFVLPAFGVGEFEQLIALNTCTTGDPTGLAGQAAGLLKEIPLVGGTLAQGGIWSGVGAGAIAIAGTMAANRMEKRSENKSIFSWHGAVRAATLATSALIAAPALLQALTMSTHFFALLAGAEIYGDPSHFSDIITFSQYNIGKLGVEGASAGASALSTTSALVPHILSCGVAAGVGSAAISSTAHHAVKGNESAPATCIQPFTSQVEKFKQAIAVPRQSMA